MTHKGLRRWKARTFQPEDDVIYDYCAATGEHSLVLHPARYRARTTDVHYLVAISAMGRTRGDAARAMERKCLALGVLVFRPQLLTRAEREREIAFRKLRGRG